MHVHRSICLLLKFLLSFYIHILKSTDTLSDNILFYIGFNCFNLLGIAK